MDAADVFRIADRVSACAEQITEAIGIQADEAETSASSTATVLPV
jgi:hypothetical protein